MMTLNPVEIWLDKVQRRHSNSEKTRKNYELDLQRFCNFIGMTPTQILDEWDRVRQTGQLIDRDLFTEKMLRMVDAYEAHLGKRGLAKATIFVYLASPASFFKYWRLPIKIEFGKLEPTYHNRDITKEEIKRILENSAPRYKAFYLMMIQSGLRPITLLRLTYKLIKEDFEAEKIPCLIKVPKQIAKGEYSEHFTFIGEDAVKALKAYFNERGVPEDDERIFKEIGRTPVVSERFGYAVRSLGLIKPERMRPGRKPQELRLYCLRKYFRKFAGPAGPDFVNFWMGHQTSYGTALSTSDQAYFSKDVEYHRKIYSEKALPLLRIYEPSALERDQTYITTLQQEIKELKGRLEIAEQFMDERWPTLEQIDNYRLATTELRQRIKELETLNSSFYKALEAFPELAKKIKEEMAKREASQK